MDWQSALLAQQKENPAPSHVAWQQGWPCAQLALLAMLGVDGARRRKTLPRMYRRQPPWLQFVNHE